MKRSEWRSLCLGGVLEESKVQFPGEAPLQGLLPVHDHERDLGLGVELLELAEELGQDIDAHRGRGPQDELAGIARAELAHDRIDLFDETQELLGIGEKHLAGIGQGDSPVDPLEQLHVQGVFQIFDLDAHRGLREVHLLGRLSDAQRLGRDVENVNLMNIHRNSRVNLLFFKYTIKIRYLTHAKMGRYKGASL
ncbi:MAG: hypothetical protein WAR22_10420 [Desulfomonilia bacterium]